MYYQPPRGLGLLVGSVITLWAAAVALTLFNNGLTADVGIGWFLSYAVALAGVALTALFAYWTYALSTLSYAVDRNGLVIAWGPTRHVIPLGAIERLVPGTSVGVPHVRGVSWWGHHVGRAHIERIGDVLFYSAHESPEQVLYVMTTERNYAISVENPADFARAIQVRQDLGPTTLVTHHVDRSGTAAQGFWSDRLALALCVLAIAASATVWVQVALRLASLPEMLDLHFPPAGPRAIVSVVARDALLELPRTASLILGINLVVGAALHLWDRVTGYVVLIAAVLIQAAFYAAVALALA
ncbi:MAG: hypothetical protein EXR65_00520 [Dehalococcoidia bacterium]|nr:hypothetical protein [Dehalococcoidia bacterium]